MFMITQGSGFMMTLGNGWTVSVQFGAGNYGSNRDADFNMVPRLDTHWEARTAEIAAWYGKQRDGNWYNFGTDQVKGWVTANEVVEFLGMISKLPSRKLTQADYEPIETALEVTYVTPV